MNFISLSMVAMSLFTSAHFSPLTAAANVKSMTQDNPAYAVQTVALPNGIEPKAVIGTSTVQDFVKDYFKDIPIMAKIASCESHFRQVDSSGDVLRGVQNTFDVGVMQINEKYHLERSEKMGMNIYSLVGNLQYARALYNTSGTAPWSASEACWSNL